ncbi:MAG: cbb3-type cytochrome c oxidase subunit I [Verrucomicrobium sp.]|nr:cbb3-type cytochrome c oxidase subunit I [Verrucomicrobium sp.]
MSAPDHKQLGLRYLWTSLGFLLFGGLLAIVMRWQVAFPREHLMTAATYHMILTMHSTVMVFLVVMPLLLGAFGNYVVPLQIGARGLLFPRLGVLSYWLYAASGAVLLASFWVPGGGAQAGWTSYAPLSTLARYNLTQVGQTCWCVAVFLNVTGSLCGAVNLLATVVLSRAPGMAFFRMPLFTWSVAVSSVLVVVAAPVLQAALVMLVLDLDCGTAFFDAARGGQPLLWQHLFWFFAHPEVYILILPAMGIVSEVLPVFARKPVFGYRAMVWAMIAIALLGFLVWGHHMFVSGMSLVLAATFSLSTLLIAVPSGIKTFNWMGTVWGGSIEFALPMLYALGFVTLFVIGGLSGIFMASTPVDLFVHHTYFIVAHIHYVLFGGSLFGVFAGIAYWYPKMFGRMMDPFLGRLHFGLTLAFFNLTFFPMHFLGLGGMMRRISDPLLYEHLVSLQPINQLCTLGAVGLGLAQIPFVVNFFRSLRHGAPAGPNPWRAATLEWACPSPPPPGNFEKIPLVTRGPYEYSLHPSSDYRPQNDS